MTATPPLLAGEKLLERWHGDWRELGASPADPMLFTAVAGGYGDPRRRYHTLQHLQECFERFDEARSLAEHPAEIAMALWFHDAIYDATRHDNEEKSAEFARESLVAAGVEDEAAERVHALILATRHRSAPSDRDAALLVDIDLAILAKAPARFAEYEQQVREEYAHVPLSEFREARRKILEEFLARPRIFLTPFFHGKYEDSARRNILASLSRRTTARQAGTAPQTRAISLGSTVIR